MSLDKFALIILYMVFKYNRVLGYLLLFLCFIRELDILKKANALNLRV